MKKRQPIPWKKGIALILCGALFSYFSHLVLNYFGIELSDSASEHSTQFMLFFIVSMALLFGATYALSYFIVHVTTLAYQVVFNSISIK